MFCTYTFFIQEIYGESYNLDTSFTYSFDDINGLAILLKWAQELITQIKV